MRDIELIHYDKKNEYKIYLNNYIIENKDEFVKDINTAYDRFNVAFKNKSSTWTYQYYNIFSLTFGSLYFYRLYQSITHIVKDFNIKDEPLWIQSWINVHNSSELLDWHAHGDATFHGYVSIDPKNTKTIFENYEIDNEIGKIYIGQSDKIHKVITNDPNIEKRITLAFDIYNHDAYCKVKDKFDNDINLSFFPIC